MQGTNEQLPKVSGGDVLSPGKKKKLEQPQGGGNDFPIVLQRV